MNVKRTLLATIAVFMVCAHTAVAQTKDNAEVSIKFYDRTMYYPGDADSNPVYVYITLSNTTSETLRFKVADDKMFSVDFIAFNVKKAQLPSTQGLIRKRTTNQTVYFREITLEKNTHSERTSRIILKSRIHQFTTLNSDSILNFTEIR